MNDKGMKQILLPAEGQAILRVDIHFYRCIRLSGFIVIIYCIFCH